MHNVTIVVRRRFSLPKLGSNLPRFAFLNGGASRRRCPKVYLLQLTAINQRAFCGKSTTSISLGRIHLPVVRTVAVPLCSILQTRGRQCVVPNAFPCATNSLVARLLRPYKVFLSPAGRIHLFASEKLGRTVPPDRCILHPQSNLTVAPCRTEDPPRYYCTL